MAMRARQQQLSKPSTRSGSPRSPRSPVGDYASVPNLIMSGWGTSYQSINGVYEPRGTHNGRTFWQSRTSNNCIHHTGKTRWVVSQDLGDGTQCFAFLGDDGTSASPAQCGGRWTRCDQRGQWVEDKSISISATTSGTNDPFVKLRYQAEEDMANLRISDEADRQKMWQRIDANGSGSVDLAEAETLVHDLVKTGVWPTWINDEQSMKRAFEKTLQDSIDGGDSVDVKEFHDLLLNIFWFGKIHEVFVDVDTQNDMEVDLQEFQDGLRKLGLQMNQAEMEREFRSIDKNANNVVEFAEFCLYVRNRTVPEKGHSGETSHDRMKVACHTNIVLKAGKGATTGVMIKKKAWGDFEDLEKKIQKLVTDPSGKGLKKLWSSLDFNGNNVVSLAEVDKMVVDQYPLLNHKPALMRAYQATVQGGGGRDFVEKKDFKALLTNLFYYNKLFWVFDQADEGKDRRVDFQEFQFMLTMCGMKMAPAKAKAEFEKCDHNGGGIILFDEFCEYFVQKKCPEGLTSFVADE